MQQEQQNVILVTRDFAEASAVAAALNARGISCRVERVSPAEGARTPTKRVTVAPCDASAAREVAADIAARRSHVREVLPPAKKQEHVTEHYTPQGSWGLSALDLINLID